MLFAGLPEPVGAWIFGWSRSRNFHPAPAPIPTPTLQNLKYIVFTVPVPKYDYKYDQCCGAGPTVTDDSSRIYEK